MKDKLIRLGVAGLLLLPAAGVTACDREDARDVEEVGNDLQKEVDQVDSDGKDD